MTTTTVVSQQYAVYRKSTKWTVQAMSSFLWHIKSTHNQKHYLEYILKNRLPGLHVLWVKWYYSLAFCAGFFCSIRLQFPYCVSDCEEVIFKAGIHSFNKDALKIFWRTNIIFILFIIQHNVNVPVGLITVCL